MMANFVRTSMNVLKGRRKTLMGTNAANMTGAGKTISQTVKMMNVRILILVPQEVMEASHLTRKMIPKHLVQTMISVQITTRIIKKQVLKQKAVQSLTHVRKVEMEEKT